MSCGLSLSISNASRLVSSSTVAKLGIRAQKASDIQRGLFSEVIGSTGLVREANSARTTATFSFV